MPYNGWIKIIGADVDPGDERYPKGDSDKNKLQAVKGDFIEIVEYIFYEDGGVKGTIYRVEGASDQAVSQLVDAHKDHSRYYPGEENVGMVAEVEVNKL